MAILPSASGPGCRQTLTVMFMPARVRYAPRDPVFRARWRTEKRVRSLARPDRIGAPLADARRRNPSSQSLVAPLLHLDVVIDQWFLVQDRFAITGVLPGRDVGELVVLAQCLPV